MALELIRRWENFGLGNEPIEIGLYVGGDSLPNKIKDLREECEKKQKGKQSKIPFDKCPWCGQSLSEDF